jgi:tetratricopeptide (TPR) repeat protein
MAKIALRAYNREIESLIERGQNQEAIAHGKHILRYFPKCIDTYRLLGKAYLESQRYTEAADILQRILSVIPDDFVSQIGTSIIREDEGNLDAAIYHMERAFEVQPSNSAIQEELRRLYGRRDGVEPPRVRLTRGALVRMYARGDLYRQAIAEARAALAEEPKRIDLEIILGQMYYQSGQKVEATEVCGRLVTKLPYCLAANQILSEILPGTSRAEDAKLYIQRIQALDPYQTYISQNAPTGDQVPEQAITLDQLEYQSEQATQEPEWAKSVGIQLVDDKKADNLPDWMGGLSEDQELPAQLSETDPLQPDLTQSANSSLDVLSDENVEIPDWMREAGWSTASGEPQEPPAPFDAVEDTGLESEIVPGNVPDWLAQAAPKEKASTEIPEEQEKLDWLETILPQSAENIEGRSDTPNIIPAIQDIPIWLGEIGPAKPGEQGETAPDSMTVQPIQQRDDKIVSSSNENLIPDWLTTTELPTDSTPESVSQEDNLPEWLRSFDSPEPEQPLGQPSSEISNWIDSTESEPSTTEETERPINEILPDPIPVSEVENVPLDILPDGEKESGLEQVAGETEPTPITGSASSELTDIDAAMAWLESLAVKQGASEALTTIPEKRLEYPPEWVQEEMHAGSEQKEDLTPISQEEEIPGDIPEPPLALPQDETPVFTTEPEPGSKFKRSPELDADSAFAWLEGLAARQGATEALILNPEERTEIPPAWVMEETGKSEIEFRPEENIQNVPELASPLSESEIMYPLSESGPVGSIDEVEHPIPSTQEEVQKPEVSSSTNETDTDAAFAWLESLSARQGATEAIHEAQMITA